jgi:hypothetical protein
MLILSRVWFVIPSLSFWIAKSLIRKTKMENLWILMEAEGQSAVSACSAVTPYPQNRPTFRSADPRSIA